MKKTSFLRSSFYFLWHYWLGLRLGLQCYWMVCLGNESRSFCCFLRLHPSTIFMTFVVNEAYTISFLGFLPTVVNLMVIWIKFTHSHPFYFTDSENVSVHSCHLLLDHVQFTLIHGPNIPGSYAILFLTESDFHHQTHPQMSIISTLA